MRGDDDLAAVVRANSFQLIDPASSLLVAELGTATLPEALSMYYPSKTADPTPKYLQWGQSNLSLSGPAAISNGAGIDFVAGQLGVSPETGFVGVGAPGGDGAQAGVAYYSTTGGHALIAAIAAGTTTSQVECVQDGSLNLTSGAAVKLNGKTARVLTQAIQLPCSLNTSSAVAHQIIPGMSTSIASLNAGDVLEVVAACELQVTTAGALGITLFALRVNSVERTQQLRYSHTIVDLVQVGGRWFYTVPSAGTYTVEIMIWNNGGGGASQVNATNSWMTVGVHQAR